MIREGDKVTLPTELGVVQVVGRGVTASDARTSPTGVGKICDVRLVNYSGDRKEIRVGFSNDRHHAAAISPPYTSDQVADAFMVLARNIRNDPNLK